MRYLLLTLFLIGCSTQVEFTEYKANAVNINGTVYITQTEYQLPTSLTLNFNQDIPQGDFGLIFDRSFDVVKISKPHEGLCNGFLGC